MGSVVEDVEEAAVAVVEAESSSAVEAASSLAQVDTSAVADVVVVTSYIGVVVVEAGWPPWQTC